MKLYFFHVLFSDRLGMTLALPLLSDPDRFFSDYTPHMYERFIEAGGYNGVCGPIVTRCWSSLAGIWPLPRCHVLINFMYTWHHITKFMSSGEWPLWAFFSEQGKYGMRIIRVPKYTCFYQEFHIIINTPSPESLRTNAEKYQNLHRCPKTGPYRPELILAHN